MLDQTFASVMFVGFGVDQVDRSGRRGPWPRSYSTMADE
jgi:hypothetical protein